MPRIKDIGRNEAGEIETIKLDDGRTLSWPEAIAEAEKGIIKGVFVGTDSKGQKYLRPRRDDDYDDNLDALSLI
ncbi:MAG: DUF3892 domain-containing protein [Syntrophothermaceae bacterium]